MRGVFVNAGRLNASRHRDERGLHPTLGSVSSGSAPPRASLGWSGRPGEGGAWGALVGAGADALTPTLDLRLRLKMRRQHGGF